MKTHQILFQLLGRNFFYGALTGALLGTFVGVAFGIITFFTMSSSSSTSNILGNLAVVILFGVLVGGIIGMCLGMLYGLVAGMTGGLVTTAITMLIFYPLTNTRWYTIVTRTLTTMISIISGIWIVPQLLQRLFSVSSPASTSPTDLIYILIYSVLSGSAAFWSSGRITEWYIRKSQELSLNTSNQQT